MFFGRLPKREVCTLYICKIISMVEIKFYNNNCEVRSNPGLERVYMTVTKLPMFSMLRIVHAVFVILNQNFTRNISFTATL